MFDIGGWEFLIIIVLGIIIIGPKELPGAIRNVMLWVRKAKGLAREFQGGLDEIAREVELDKVKSDIESGLGADGGIGALKDDIESAIDPTGEITGAFDYDESDWYSDHIDEEDEDDELPSIEAPDLARAKAGESDDTRDTPAADEVADDTDQETEIDSADAGTRA